MLLPPYIFSSKFQNSNSSPGRLDCVWRHGSRKHGQERGTCHCSHLSDFLFVVWRFSTSCCIEFCFCPYLSHVITAVVVFAGQTDSNCAPPTCCFAFSVKRSYRAPSRSSFFNFSHELSFCSSRPVVACLLSSAFSLRTGLSGSCSGFQEPHARCVVICFP